MVQQRLSNKDIFYLYCKTFNLDAKRGLPGGQHIGWRGEEALASFESSDGAYTKGKVFFIGTELPPKHELDDPCPPSYTRDELLAAIKAGTPPPTEQRPHSGPLFLTRDRVGAGPRSMGCFTP